jgi:cytochrome P450
MECLFIRQFKEGWNNVLVISDPALVEQVYNKHFECFHIRRVGDRLKIYYFVNFGLIAFFVLKELGAHIFNRDAGKNLLGLNGPEWKQQRASALHAFSRKELREKVRYLLNI